MEGTGARKERVWQEIGGVCSGRRSPERRLGSCCGGREGLQALPAADAPAPGAAPGWGSRGPGSAPAPARPRCPRTAMAAALKGAPGGSQGEALCHRARCCLGLRSVTETWASCEFLQRAEFSRGCEGLD